MSLDALVLILLLFVLLEESQLVLLYLFVIAILVVCLLLFYKPFLHLLCLQHHHVLKFLHNLLVLSLMTGIVFLFHLELLHDWLACNTWWFEVLLLDEELVRVFFFAFYLLQLKPCKLGCIRSLELA